MFNRLTPTGGRRLLHEVEGTHWLDLLLLSMELMSDLWREFLLEWTLVA